MFVIQNGKHRTITREAAHEILVCQAREDAWKEDAETVLEG
jgi:hypothetical protein